MSFAATALRLSTGIIVWALHFALVYGFTALACAREVGIAAVPWGIAAASLVAVALGAAFILRELRRNSFDAWLAAGLAAAALVAIVWETLPVLFVPVCR